MKANRQEILFQTCSKWSIDLQWRSWDSAFSASIFGVLKFIGTRDAWSLAAGDSMGNGGDVHRNSRVGVRADDAALRRMSGLRGADRPIELLYFG